MANTIIRLNHNQKLFPIFGLFSLFLLFHKGCGFEFKVGGSKGWTVPNDLNDLQYNQWAEKKRFQIGDTLRFVYQANNDSVLLVTKEDYNNCNTTHFLEKFSEGQTVYTIKESGPHYFISGVRDNCLKNEKMVVVVLADRGNKSSQKGGACSIVLSFFGSVGAFVGSSLLLVL